MAREHNAFNINLGDTIYSDSEVAGAPPALTVADKWAKYRQNLAVANLRKVRAAAAMYNHWDDHEFINDFSRDEDGSSDLRRRRRRRSADYMPVTYSAGERHLPLVPLGQEPRGLLPRRALVPLGEGDRQPRLRQPAAPARPTSRPRLPPAPARPSRRDRAVAEAARLAGVPGRAQRPEPHDARRRPVRALQQRDQALEGDWKVIMNEVPIQQFYALPYDRWEGYEAERPSSSHFLQDNVATRSSSPPTTTRTSSTTCQVHDARGRGRQGLGIYDFATGPVRRGRSPRRSTTRSAGPASADLVRGALLQAPAARTASA